MKWIFLLLAIFGEITGTTALKYSDGFSKLLPSIIVVMGYGFSFFFLSMAFKEIPIGVAYAIWGGVGIIILSIISYFLFKQTLDRPAIIGIVLIILGTLIINLFSKSATH